MESLPLALAYFAAGIAVLGSAIGAAVGIGRLAGSALDGMARQPEAGSEIRNTMIVAAAFIEGVALFGEIIAILLIFATGA
ncbi:MAG: ATP synthase F0 subunit C [Candidatus Latescibacterota bacterium]|jgi:F-type H+-transporting ATPase subunit c